LAKWFSDPGSFMAEMSPEEKVGQMMVAGFRGTTPSCDIRNLIEEYHIGGVILFSRNVLDPLQVARLTKKLQDIAIKSKPHLPLIVATDQEGGIVARIRKSTSVHPGQMALGATRSDELTYAAGDITGKELRAMGINMNLAPALDVNSNPRNPVVGVRSFSENPTLVSRLGVAMIRGLQKNRVIATAKHFPGHGDTSHDSHETLPVLPHPLERLKQVELRPFRAAIIRGVMAVMVGHLSIPTIDRKHGTPATLSKRIITGLLRRDLRHQGLVTTDCMEMKAITSNFESGEAAVKAVKAGVDLVMVSHTLKRQLESIRATQDALRGGEINQKQIDLSVLRVLKAKAFAEKRYAPTYRIGNVGTRNHLKLIARMAEKSITLTMNRGVLPLKPERKKTILSICFVPSSFARSSTDFPATLRRKTPSHIRIRHFRCDPRPPRKQIMRVRRAASQAELVVAASYDVTHNAVQGKILREIAARLPLVIVSMKEPYDVACVPEASAHIAAYSPAECSVEAAVDVIVGRSRPAGRLPVSIPPLYAIGHGLRHF